MALLKGKLFAGALFAGALMGAPEAPVEQPKEVAAITRPASTGSAYYDTGRAYVKKDHGWVKATKYGKAGGEALDVTTVQKAQVFLATAKSEAAKALPGHATSIRKADTIVAKALATPYASIAVASNGVAVELVGTQARVNSLKADWLSADELLVILETMT